MNPKPFEYEPLERLFDALESDFESMTPAERIDDLRSRGLHPEETTAAIKMNVATFLNEKRLSWQDAARQKQSALRTAADSIVSWTSRTKEEIEAAFEKARQGAFGDATQGKLQAAFRNVSHVPTDDKASFLDEIEILQSLKGKEAPPEE